MLCYTCCNANLAEHKGDNVMKMCNAIILYRDKNDRVGISFTDDLRKRCAKFKVTDFTKFEVITLPNSMTKFEALRYVKTLDVYQDEFFNKFVNDKIGKYLNRLPIDKSDVQTVLDIIKLRPKIDAQV